MSNAPKRIWAVEGVGEVLSFNTYNQGGTEYVRADLVQQLKNRIIELEETISGRYEQMEEE